VNAPGTTSQVSACRRVLDAAGRGQWARSGQLYLRIIYSHQDIKLILVIMNKQECAAVEGLPAMGPSLQLSTCVLPHGDSKCCHLLNHLDLTTLHGERALVVVDFSPTTQLAAVTLTSDPLTLKLVHGVLGSLGPFLPSLVFVGLFVFPLGGGMGKTDRRTDGRTDGRTGSIHNGASF